MPETMVERVGREARRAAFQYTLSFQMMSTDDPNGVPCDVMSEGKVVFSGTPPECQAWVTQQVGRAAIAAMREPTRMMGWCGLQTTVLDDEEAGTVVQVWQAMIDAALAEKEP